MAKYLMLALNGPTGGKGDEATFNKWYDEVHLPDFKAIDGIRVARRYKVINGNLPGKEAWPYLAVYEIETEDLGAVLGRLARELRPFDPTLDREHSANLIAIQIGGDD
jgi:hypothetical protein